MRVSNAAPSYFFGNKIQHRYLFLKNVLADLGLSQFATKLREILQSAGKW